MTEYSQHAPNHDRHFLRNLWRRRTLYVLISSRVVIVLAAAMFIAGAAIYFANLML